MGQLFLTAGFPTRASEVFRGILREAPTSAVAHAGLGEADFARGNYRAAQSEFQMALRLAPDDSASLQRLNACNQLLALDPAVRGLGQAERFRRSVKLVELTLGEATRCADHNPSPELEALLDKAGKALKTHVTATRQGEVSESNVELADQLCKRPVVAVWRWRELGADPQVGDLQPVSAWQAAKKECKSPPAGNSAIALVLARLAQ